MLGTLELVRNSDWATVVASIAVMDEVKQGRLIAEPIYGPELWLDFYLIRTKDRLLSPRLPGFLALVERNTHSCCQGPRADLSSHGCLKPGGGTHLLRASHKNGCSCLRIASHRFQKFRVGRD